LKVSACPHATTSFSQAQNYKFAFQKKRKTLTTTNDQTDKETQKKRAKTEKYQTTKIFKYFQNISALSHMKAAKKRKILNFCLQNTKKQMKQNEIN